MVAAFVVTMAVVAAGTVPVVAIVWRGSPLPGPSLQSSFAYDVQSLATYALHLDSRGGVDQSPIAGDLAYRVLPRWLCVLGVVEIAVNAVELIGLASRHGALAGGYAAGVGPLLWVLWFAAASICMAWQARQRAGAR